MLGNSHAFSGFSVDDMKAAKEFYGDTLGLNVEQTDMELRLHLARGNDVFVYQKDIHQPATFTILNFPVKDIDQAVKDLKAKGVSFEHYEGMNDDQDIARGIEAHRGPDIAWFTDPAGNILSVLQHE